ncbi:MAG: hypothetical protein QOK29_1761 [Rhodospirillaceae bacterium]|nr:hypothetical protein [Rhodospirillaceae bacterium]
MTEREGKFAAELGRVAVWPLVAESYRSVFHRPTLFLRLGWCWLASAWLLGLALDLLLADNRGRLIGQFLTVPLLIAFAVAWHRITLSREAPKELQASRFGSRELRYFAAMVIFMSLVFGVLVLGGLLYELLAGGAKLRDLQWVIGILAPIGSLFATRFVLVLPAIAIGDRTTSLVRSWRLTRGHTLPLFAGLCAACVPMMLFKYAIVGGMYLLLGSVAADYSLLRFVLVIPLFLFFDLAGTAASVSFLSHAYRAFTRGDFAIR